jgi:peptide/nickel transport system ATP-binding protein
LPPLIEIENLVTNYHTYEGVVRALDRVSLSFDHGTTFGLVGESGCGKSVTVRSLMRIVQEPGRIEAGRILFYPSTDRASGAIDLLQQSESFMQRFRGDQISMIFQEPNAALNPIMSAGEQVAESFWFHRRKEMAANVLAALEIKKSPLRYGYRRAANNPDDWMLKLGAKLPVFRNWDRALRREARRRAVEMIAKLGIANADQVFDCYPHELSGGMKQRIVIAIALACNPVLLIADEATSNLDVTIQAQILQLLQQLKQQEISSVLIITHDLGVIAETCDRVGVMYAGQLCEVADVSDLFRAPLHPYTRALIGAVPKMAQQELLKSIEGSVPNLVEPPPGCRFHPRCPHAKKICRKQFPAMIEADKRHRVACYLYTSSPRQKE